MPFCYYIKPKMPESLYYLFLSGLVLGSGPCLGFCAPVLISFVSVYRTSFSKAALSYLAFSVCKMISYMFLGFLLGSFSGTLKDSMLSKHLQIVNVILGLSILGVGLVTIISKNISGNKYCSFLTSGDLKSCGVLGFLSGLSPCFILFGILNYVVFISRSGLEGLLYALAFGLGTVLSPIILLIGLSGKLSGILSRNKTASIIIRVISGATLIFLGLRIMLSFFIS